MNMRERIEAVFTALAAIVAELKPRGTIARVIADATDELQGALAYAMEGDGE